jgi:hypothetical protein
MLVAAPQCGAAWFIPLNAGGEVTGAGWGQSGYVGGQEGRGPGGGGVSATQYTNRFVIYERLPTWHRPLV